MHHMLAHPLGTHLHTAMHVDLDIHICRCTYTDVHIYIYVYYIYIYIGVVSVLYECFMYAFSQTYVYRCTYVHISLLYM